MGLAKRKLRERPRELRRRVILPARLRTGADWSDTCMLNISSRGLLIQLIIHDSVAVLLPAAFGLKPGFFRMPQILIQ